MLLALPRPVVGRTSAFEAIEAIGRLPPLRVLAEHYTTAAPAPVTRRLTSEPSGRMLSGDCFSVLLWEALRDTRPVEWHEQAQAAEQTGDWDTAISLVSARAECFSADFHAHSNHLWHMDLLVRAERFDQLTELAVTDVHACRRLNRSLHERGMETELRNRASDGDGGALYHLVRWLYGTGRPQEACRAVQDLGPEDEYAHQLVADLRTPTSDAR